MALMRWRKSPARRPAGGLVGAQIRMASRDMEGNKGKTMRAIRAPSHKSEIRRLVELGKCLSARVNVLPQAQRLQGTAGIPDCYVQIVRWRLHNGKDQNSSLRFWVEVKVGRDKLSTAQQAFKAHEEACGGIVIVGGIADVERFLRARGFLK